MPKLCKVPGCSTKQGSGYSLHDFPEVNDIERKCIWAQFCGIDDAAKILSHHVICEKHFPSSAFLARNNRIKEGGRNILKNDAVPELNSPADLRLVGYLSPTRDPPVQKKSRRSDPVVVHQWTFVSVVCLIDYIQHLSKNIQQNVFVSYDRTSCFFYTCLPYSRIFGRRLSFTDSLLPEMEVRGQLYTGALMSTVPIDSSDKLRDLIDVFLTLRDCDGIGQLYARANKNEYAVDSFGRTCVDPIYRATGCEFLMPAKPANRKRCDGCRKLHSKLDQRVEVAHVTEEPEMMDAEDRRTHKVHLQRERRHRNKAAANRAVMEKLESRVAVSGATPMDRLLGSLPTKMRDFIESDACSVPLCQ